jgi:hypothetical protein
MQGQAKTIRSPYSGEYINPRITTREDRDTVYTEAIYICPSSGNFVQKVVLDTQPKKKVETPKVVNEGLGELFLKAMQYAGAGLTALSIGKQIIPDGECDPDQDEDCNAVEEDNVLQDDQILDHERGTGLEQSLSDIKAKIEEVTGTDDTENEEPGILINRNNLFDLLKEVKDELAVILASFDHQDTDNYSS